MDVLTQFSTVSGHDHDGTDSKKVDVSTLTIASQAVGDIIYASSTTVWARLATSATATRYLANTGASNIPAWAQVNLANGVTGTLPVDNGGTGGISLTPLGTANGGTGLTTKIINFVTYTGTSSDKTVAHGLGTTPSAVVICELGNNSSNPYLWITGMPSLAGRALDNVGTMVANIYTSAPDATNVYLAGAKTDVNENGLSYMLIVFADQ